MTESVKTCYLPSRDMDTFEEVLQHHFRISKVLCIIICFLSNVLFLNSGGGIECILVIMHSFPNGEQCGGPGFYPFEIHVFSILHNVLSIKAMCLVV